MNNKILRVEQVCERISISRATLYRLVNKGEFAKKIQLSTRAVGFHIEDIDKWIEERRMH